MNEEKILELMNKICRKRNVHGVSLSRERKKNSWRASIRTNSIMTGIVKFRDGPIESLEAALEQLERDRR